MTDVERSPNFIHSLERGLAVINSFSRERPAQTLSEVAKATDLTRATARRVLLTLAELGYVRQTGRDFSLTPKVIDLGYSFLSSFRVTDLAQPWMESLADEIQESSSMSILDGPEIVYVARVPTKRIMTISLALGSRLPAYPTSMGRVLLAGLAEAGFEEYLARVRLEPLTRHTITDKEKLRSAVEQARRDGYALVDQELEEGVRSVAAPIHGAAGAVIAAMNVSGHASRVTVAEIRRRFLPLLLEAAEKTSAAVVALGIR
jgi:IclR family pca regulon transcriptional regulator